jgi:3-oxoacyl-[acyl-carrier-protein] synthase-3
MRAKISGLKISAISACVPKTKLDLSSLVDDFGESEINRIIKTTGISSVRQVNNNTTTSDLCYLSSKRIIADCNIQPDAIDGLIFVSQTADYKLPQTSHILQSQLGLKEDTICYDLPIGCNGYIYGLFQASLLIQSSACKKVLVLSGDTTTKIINDKDRSLKMVFGDGGSSTLIEKGDDDMSFIIYSDGERHQDLIIKSGGCRIPYSKVENELITDFDGNSRTNLDLFMDGMSIFNFAIKRVPALIEEILNYTNWNKEDIDLFGLHQANKFMIDYLRKKTKISMAKMPVVVDGFGNTGPATIPILLTETLNDDNILNYKKVILCGFGVGLSWGAISCDLSKTKIIKTLEYEL